MNYPRYGAVFLAVALGTAFLVGLLQVSMDQAIGLYARILVPAMIAALIEGQQFVKRNRRKPNTAEAWGFAITATGVAMVLNLTLGYMVPNFAPAFAALTEAPAFSIDFNTLLVIYVMGYLVSNRFFLALGVGNEVSADKRRDEMKGPK